MYSMNNNLCQPGRKPNSALVNKSVPCPLKCIDSRPSVLIAVTRGPYERFSIRAGWGG